MRVLISLGILVALIGCKAGGVTTGRSAGISGGNNGSGGGSGSNGGGGGGGGSGGASLDMAGAVSDLAPAVAPLDLANGGAIRANRRLSRGRPITSSAGASTLVDGNPQPQPLTTLVDGIYNCCDGFQAAAPAWVALDLGSGPTRILVTWLAHGQADAPTNQPIDYHIDVSPDGNSWITKATVAGNDTTAREDAVDFTGQRFVRISVDKAGAGVLALVELEAYDISGGSDDTWLFLGDSITAMSMNPPLFANLIEQARPGFTPMMIGAAIGGTQTMYALDHIDGWIARYPDIRNVALAYGTNDAGCDTTGSGAPGYLARMQTLIDKLKAAGKRVLVPHIPWNEYCANTPTLLAPYNSGLDALRAQDFFVAGPDLYSWFAAHQEQLGPDHVHPTNDGVTSLNQLWATAAAALY